MTERCYFSAKSLCLARTIRSQDTASEDVSPVHRPSPFTARLRRSRYMGWFALWLILLQVFAAAGHLSATAAVAAGAPPFAFLNICSAQGIAASPIDRTEGSQRDAVTNACALCAMDAMAGHAIVGDTTGSSLPLPSGSHEQIWLADVQCPLMPRLRYGTVRGPPVPSVA